MAASVDEARFRVEAQRTVIQRKIEALKSRAADDLAELQDRGAHHAAHAVDLVPGGTAVIGAVKTHPVAGLAGALGAGIVLGMATDGMSSDGHRDKSEKGSGALHTVAETLKDPAMGLTSALSAGPLAFLQPYVEGMVNDLFSSPSKSEPPSSLPGHTKA